MKPSSTGESLTVALVIGGHPFDVPITLDAFDSISGIDVYPQDLPTFAYDTGDAMKAYDAAVFYNYHENGIGVELTDEAYERTIDTVREMGERGIGILPLHHGTCALPETPEWAAVCGLAGSSLDGAYQDETFRVDVADGDHPITAELSGFEFVDETYTMDEPNDSRVLLSTDHDPSARAIAWVRQYRNSRVFCYQSGHGPSAFTDENFLTVLTRGIRWVGGSEDASPE